MKKKDLKRHLQDYSIFSKRSSTINHAFASALSIADDYDEEKINTALKILGQDPNADLLCAYCDKSAETWDHIKAVVSKSSFSGHGHQINNLIPCCKDCNSAKGNKEWNVFLQIKNLDTQERIDRITNYINHNYIDAKNLLQTEDFKADLTEFNEIKEQVFQLLKKGDQKAKVIRDKIRKATTV
ncbi:MAG: HNH endonuclease [Flavobacteriales bacterium]|nr:HNH endonuclease [Flavobacteriales bacterium]